MKTSIFRLPLLALLLASITLLTAPGCTEMLAGSWGQLSPERGDLTKVKKGWNTVEVMNRIGQPDHVNHGENIGTGWQEWVYPNGSIVFYRLAVAMVEIRPKGSKLDAYDKEGREAEEEKWKYRDHPFGRDIEFNNGELEGLGG